MEGFDFGRTVRITAILVVIFVLLTFVTSTAIRLKGVADAAAIQAATARRQAAQTGGLPRGVTPAQPPVPAGRRRDRWVVES